MRKDRTIFFALLCLSLAPSPSVGSEVVDDEEQLVPFQEIVRELGRAESQAGRSTLRQGLRSTESDPFADIWIHSGVGFVQSAQTVTLPNGSNTNIANRGVQVALGIDLFNPQWAAEGTVRSMTDEDALNFRAQLQEFDLKLLYRPLFADSSRMRIGAGVSGRYLTLQAQSLTFDSVTPSSVLTFGADFYLTSQVSLGVDLGYRAALVTDTFDRSSFDGTVRLDAHF